MDVSVSETAPHQQVRLGEIWVDSLRFQQAVDLIERRVEQRQGGYVVTPNVDHVVLADEHPEFRQAYADAALAVADGKPLLWAARLLGHPLPAKISGSDLGPVLMERAAARGWRVFLLGAGPGVADKAAARLRQDPGVNVVGTLSPRLEADGRCEPSVLEAVRAAKPDLVLVAFGAPKQELFCHRVAEALAPALLVCCGATIDFIAGTVPRAPAWMSNVGLEWAYRLGREPRRLWRRYLVQDPKFVFSLWRTLRLPPAERVR